MYIRVSWVVGAGVCVCVHKLLKLQKTKKTQQHNNSILFRQSNAPEFPSSLETFQKVLCP